MRLFLAGVARGMAEQLKRDRSRFIAHLITETPFYVASLEQISSVLLKARKPSGLTTDYGSDAHRVRQGEAAANTKRAYLSHSLADAGISDEIRSVFIQYHPEITARLETGAVKLGADWPGVFIRGDDAWVYAILLTELVDAARADKRATTLDLLEHLQHTLQSCVVPPDSQGETDGDRA